MNRCRSCDAPIRWAQTPSGKKMPLNAEPDPDRGNVQLENRFHADGSQPAIIYGAEIARRQRDDGHRLYLSHHATCPAADRHRNAKKNLPDSPD